MIMDCNDLTDQTYGENIEEKRPDIRWMNWRWPIAIDPTSKYYAVGCSDGRVELRSL
jgi:hypothetical protein